MADMTFKEFAEQKERMCLSMNSCVTCGFYKYHRYSTRRCAEIMMEYPDEAENVVRAWMEEHDV